MPRALLVDYGGVLTTSVLGSFAAFCRDETLETQLVRDVFVAAARTPDNVFARVEVGALTAAQFDVELASLLSAAAGRAIASDGLKARLFARAERDEAMCAAVAAMRAQGVRTVLLSNSWGGDDYPLEELEPLFDELVISGHVGLRKPDAAIYELGAQRAGVPATECVFVDDFKVNIDAAEALGMTGVHHLDTPSTVARLNELFA